MFRGCGWPHRSLDFWQILVQFDRWVLIIWIRGQSCGDPLLGAEFQGKQRNIPAHHIVLCRNKLLVAGISWFWEFADMQERPWCSFFRARIPFPDLTPSPCFSLLVLGNSLVFQGMEWDLTAHNPSVSMPCSGLSPQLQCLKSGCENSQEFPFKIHFLPCFGTRGWVQTP